MGILRVVLNSDTGQANLKDGITYTREYQVITLIGDPASLIVEAAKKSSILPDGSGRLKMVLPWYRSPYSDSEKNIIAYDISFDKNSFNASSACPILPHAFILGATPNDIVFESIFLYPDDISKDFNPMFFVCVTSINPNFAITLFSSTNGTISDIVPTHTISKYFKYSFSSALTLYDSRIF